MKGMRKLLMVAGLVAGSHAALAQQSVQLTTLPFVQPNGLINLSMTGHWQTSPHVGALNTQVMAYPGTAMNVGGYSHQLLTFGNHNVPFFTRAPFVGGLFRTPFQMQNISGSSFNMTLTPANPTGGSFYLHTPRVQSPLMYGFIAPTPLAQP